MENQSRQDAGNRRKPDVERLLSEALALYGTRIRDNLDLDRLATIDAQARVVGRALMERGDARAFVLGRRLAAAAER